MSRGKNRAAIVSTDAATELEVTTWHVRRLYNQGDLEGYEDGRVLMIYLDSLVAYRQRRNVKYGKPGGWTSSDPPENRSARREYFRDGTPKTEADKIAAGLRERDYQRDYRRKKRERERAEAAAKGAKKKKY